MSRKQSPVQKNNSRRKRGLKSKTHFRRMVLCMQKQWNDVLQSDSSTWRNRS